MIITEIKHSNHKMLSVSSNPPIHLFFDEYEIDVDANYIKLKMNGSLSGMLHDEARDEFLEALSNEQRI